MKPTYNTPEERVALGIPKIKAWAFFITLNENMTDFEETDWIESFLYKLETLGMYCGGGIVNHVTDFCVYIDNDEIPFLTPEEQIQEIEEFLNEDKNVVSFRIEE